MKRLKQLAVAVTASASVLAFTACDTSQIMQVAQAHHGIDLTQEQAQGVATYLNTTKSTTEPVQLAAVVTPEAPCDIACLIRRRWAGTGQEERAVRIAKCESGLQANPRHNNPHYGVFQMGRSEFAHFGHGNIFNAQDNINAAFNYWKHSGWRPWACKG